MALIFQHPFFFNVTNLGPTNLPPPPKKKNVILTQCVNVLILHPDDGRLGRGELSGN